MKDREIEIYKDETYVMVGDITNGCLSLRSYIYEDDFESEQYYDFTEKETEKLFQVISLDDFIELCRDKGLVGMCEFLDKHQIEAKVYTW